MKKYILIFLFMFLFVPKIKAFDINDMGQYTIINTSGTDYNFKRSCTMDASDQSNIYKSCHFNITSHTFNQDYSYILVSSYYTYRYNRTVIDPNDDDYEYDSAFNTASGMYITATGVNYQCTTSDNGQHFICPNIANITDIVLQVYGKPYKMAQDSVLYNITMNTNQSIYLFNDKGKETTQAIKDQTNTIKSDDMTGGNQSAQDFKDNSAFDDSTGIQSIIELPLNFINSLSSTCQPLQLTLPYLDYDFTIPCLGDLIRTKVPLLANVITIVVNGFIVYRILVGILDLVKSAKNPDDDRIEVLEL